MNPTPLPYLIALTASCALLGACSHGASNHDVKTAADVMDDADEPSYASIVVHPSIGSMCNIIAPDAYFEYDSAQLSLGDETFARNLADCLTEGPLQGQEIKIIGRADARGPDGYNLKLGAKRARAVARELMAQGVPSDRMKLVTAGERGFSDDSSPLGYALQRRVDVQLIDPKPVELSIVYWDYDEDGSIAHDEFYTYISGVYDHDQWDTNDDGWLTAAEMARGVHDAWDVNDDGFVNDEEFRRGSLSWYGDTQAQGTFSDWDANDDGVVNASEWLTSFRRQGIHADSDQDNDGKLREDEFSVYVYSYWDLNDDEHIDSDELETHFGRLYWLDEV